MFLFRFVRDGDRRSDVSRAPIATGQQPHEMQIHEAAVLAEEATYFLPNLLQIAEGSVTCEFDAGPLVLLIRNDSSALR
jgi:hypothetical protein